MNKRKATDKVNLKLRFEEALRLQIEKSAKRNNRSLNSEIVHRLAVSFGKNGIALVDQYEVVQEELRELVASCIQRAQRGL